MLAAGLMACGHPAPNHAIPGRVALDFASGKIALMGTLPPQSHSRLLAKARALYGADHLTDQVSVDEGVIAAPWLDSDDLFLPLIDAPIGDGQVVFDGQTLVVTGEVANATIQAQISARLAKAAGRGIAIQNHLQVMH
jgi:hypothetical protein